MTAQGRTIKAGSVVRGDEVVIPGPSGRPGVQIVVTRATGGHRPQDYGQPDEKRPRRVIEGQVRGGRARVKPRVFRRPFGELLPVIRLVTDDV